MKAEHSIRRLCRSFEVSASGYYDWQRRRRCPCPRVLQDQQLKQEILRIHLASRRTYGSPRIQFELAAAGQRHGRNRIARLMREQALCGREQRRFRVRTTDSHHDEPIAPNRLAQRQAPSRPNEVWAADITYIATAEGWLYLAAILDLYSRRVVGWAMSQRIDTALVLAAWNRATLYRKPPQGLILHSDRGVQYASLEHRDALAQSQALASMSRKANCYDNAQVEAFWSTLKLELVYRATFATAQQARLALFDYIEVFYNRQRRHSALGYQSPVDFEACNN
jgi:putative transposase